MHQIHQIVFAGFDTDGLAMKRFIWELFERLFDHRVGHLGKSRYEKEATQQRKSRDFVDGIGQKFGSFGQLGHTNSVGVSLLAKTLLYKLFGLWVLIESSISKDFGSDRSGVVIGRGPDPTEAKEYGLGILGYHPIDPLHQLWIVLYDEATFKTVSLFGKRLA